MVNKNWSSLNKHKMNIQVKYVDLVGYPQILAGNIIL